MVPLVKFADDTALVSRTKQVSQNTFYKEESFLVLKVSRTKQLVFDSRKEKEPFKPVINNQQSLEAVSSFNYLGTIVDSKLSFSDKVVYMSKKA